MSRFKLDRRAVIRGLGGVAIALPWLEIMGEARAQATGPAKRFIGVYTPGGTVRDRWLPTGTETDFTLSPILAPLQDIKHRVLVLDGVEMRSAQGEQHQAGICALLTGTPQDGAFDNYASGPSIDQVIATRISRGIKQHASLYMAVRWATGNSQGLLSPINATVFEDNASCAPIPPRLDPVAIFNSIFAGGPGADIVALRERLARKRSILDYVDRRYDTLAKRLGSTDRAKLDAHLTKVREIEQGIQVQEDALGAQCAAPPRVDTSDYRHDIGSTFEGATDAAIPKVGRYMIDMMVTAMACDLTGVGVFQWTDTEAKHTFPWLGLGEHHHFYQHDGGYRPAELERIYNWYAQQHAYLLEQMEAVDMGGHTLLQESVVFFGSELQEPPSHSKRNMPFLLAGGGGGLRGGRFVRYDNRSHNDLLVSILNLFGDTRTSFGRDEFCDGPIGRLT